MSAVEIRLDWNELFAAGCVGLFRRIEGVYERMNSNKHAYNSNWATDIDGAAAEMVVARYLGRYWSFHSMNFAGDDVTGGIQVRSTVHKNGCLIVRSHDNDDNIFVLVITEAPVYRIVGYMRGGDAKSPEFERQADERGVQSWWVPQNRLRDISEIGGGK